jgi:hypothetical protein
MSDPRAAAKIQAVSQKQAAWLASGSAILAALLAVCASLIVGNMSSRSAEKASVDETSRVKAEFRRDRQQAAYASFLVHSGTVVRVSGELATALRQDKINYNEVDRLSDLFEKAYPALLVDIGTIEMIGGEQTVVVVDKLAEHYAMKQAAERVARGVAKPPYARPGGTKATPADVADLLTRNDYGASELLRDFKASGRRDLEI